MWKFQHPEGVRENNTLHVPVGRPVRLILTSQDVIHSFFIPAFRLKHDAVPGRYYSMWFQATQAGEFPIHCAEFCGTNHSKMNATIVVMEPADYQAWLASGGADTSTGPAANGQQLFTTLGCSGCHAPGEGKIGPGLVGIFGSTVTLSDGSTVTADENYIRESILFPQKKVVQGFNPVMPTFSGRVSEQQILALITFIKSLNGSPAPAPGGNTNAPAPTAGAAGTVAAPTGAAVTPIP
jgi:cytochrome c oxidase subunit 2